MSTHPQPWEHRWWPLPVSSTSSIPMARRNRDAPSRNRNSASNFDGGIANKGLLPIGLPQLLNCRGARSSGALFMCAEHVRQPGQMTSLNIAAQLLMYNFFLSSAWQATPGKRTAGIRVTDLAGQQITVGRAS